jgi:putative transposase
VPGGTYFFTVVTYNRGRFLCEPAACDCLRATIHECRQRWPFESIAFVLLPDHLHAIWTLPTGDCGYSQRWAWLKHTFTRRWLEARCSAADSGRIWQRRRTVWQPRFWEHTIREEKDFGNHLDYIHYNPVKHGYAVKPQDWPYSSFHRFAKLGWYEPDWGANPDDVSLRKVHAMGKTVGE